MDEHARVCALALIFVCVLASSSCILGGWSQCFGGDPAAFPLQCVRTVVVMRVKRACLLEDGHTHSRTRARTHARTFT